jgi:Ni,Fe-hydrogenase maturation factor
VAAARLMGVMPADASLVGIKPAEIDIGLALTPQVEAAVPEAIAAVCDELRRYCGTGTTGAVRSGGWPSDARGGKRAARLP